MKVTERDKILLVVLGVILIVALAVLLPGVGVMACRDNLATYKTKTADLEADLDSKLSTLKSMGVTRYQENAKKANEALQEAAFNLKVEASHLAGNIMAYAKPYAIDENWLDGLEYRYGVTSDEDEKIINYSPITDVSPSGGEQQDEIFAIDGVNYTLPSAKREITYTIAQTADCTYDVEMTMSEYSAADLAPVLLFLHNISSKGSILITEVKVAGERSISFTLLMPEEGSGISRYAQEVLEILAEREAENEGEEE